MMSAMMNPFPLLCDDAESITSCYLTFGIIHRNCSAEHAVQRASMRGTHSRPNMRHADLSVMPRVIMRVVMTDVAIDSILSPMPHALTILTTLRASQCELLITCLFVCFGEGKP